MWLVILRQLLTIAVGSVSVLRQAKSGAVKESKRMIVLVDKCALLSLRGYVYGCSLLNYDINTTSTGIFALKAHANVGLVRAWFYAAFNQRGFRQIAERI